jgi:hypothetical protein
MAMAIFEIKSNLKNVERSMWKIGVQKKKGPIYFDKAR